MQRTINGSYLLHDISTLLEKCLSTFLEILLQLLMTHYGRFIEMVDIIINIITISITETETWVILDSVTAMLSRILVLDPVCIQVQCNI